MTSASPAAPPAIDNLRGMAWIAVSALSASAMALAVRALSAEIDPRAIVLLRTAAVVLVLLVAWPFSGRLRRIRFTRWRLHLARGTLLALATHLGFWTLAHVPLATATVLFFTAPIFATILSALWLGEQVGPRRWSAVAAGFLGAVVILRPGLQGLDWAMLAALASSALYAVALTQSRDLATADGSDAAFVSAMGVTLALSLPLAWPVLALPSGGAAWGLIGVLVAAGAIRAFADIEAYRHGEAAVLAPVAYGRLVIIAIAAYLVFDEVPDAPTYAGAAIIVAATLYIAHRETRLRRSLPSAPPQNP